MKTLNAEEQFDKDVKTAIIANDSAPAFASGLSLTNQLTGYVPRITRLLTLLNNSSSNAITLDLSACTGLTAWDTGYGNLLKVDVLTLPSGCTSIGGDGFYTFSPKVVKGAGVLTVANSAFYSSRIEKCEFLAANSIADNAFYSCNNLEELKLKPSSASPTQLGNNVFGNMGSSTTDLSIQVGSGNVSAYLSAWNLTASQNPAQPSVSVSKYATDGGHKTIEIIE